MQPFKPFRAVFLKSRSLGSNQNASVWNCFSVWLSYTGHYFGPMISYCACASKNSRGKRKLQYTNRYEDDNDEWMITTNTFLRYIFLISRVLSHETYLFLLHVTKDHVYVNWIRCQHCDENVVILLVAGFFLLILFQVSNDRHESYEQMATPPLFFLWV